jgi:predicted nicotinamide N-methyase
MMSTASSQSRKSHEAYLLYFVVLTIYCNVGMCFQLSTKPRRCCKSQLFSTEHRQRRAIDLPRSGKTASVLSRTVKITPNVSLTVWEWENPAEVVESYWDAAKHQADVLHSKSKLLDPFGIVSWPGSVVAAQELSLHKENAVKDKSVLVLGAGVGLEAQASAVFGAKQVLATDIHPTTLQQLSFGVAQEEAITEKSVVRTLVLDLFAHDEQPLPECELLVVADVLYNEELASQVARRIVEAWLRNPKVRILVTDSQRFVPGFAQALNQLMDQVGGPSCDWQEQSLQFTGSGVAINEDQTYDVKVRKMWIGL